MIRTKTERKGEFTRIPDVIRIMSMQSECEVCGIPFGEMREDTDGKMWRTVQHLHHIFGRRFLNALKLNEHDRLNMIAVCQRDHGKCKKAEERLFQGDVFGYLRALKEMGFPLSYVWRAAKQYGLGEVLGFFRTESELK
jgi:hypothetical protein